MINRAKLQHILEYARQQRHIGLHCKVPPEDMVEIVEMAMLQRETESDKSVTTIKSAPALDLPPKNAESLTSNSPVIQDGLCPCCGRKQLKSRTCLVAGCEGKHVAHGFCKKHYDIERKKDPFRRESIRAADERYRARKSAASQQEVK